MSNENYYVVEARLPVQISEAASPEEAARKAARIIENMYGINVANWFLRVFEYGGTDDVGPIGVYFASPAGTKFRKIDGNIDTHEELIRNEDASND